jgi:hypothetical protein
MTVYTLELLLHVGHLPLSSTDSRSPSVFPHCVHVDLLRSIGFTKLLRFSAVVFILLRSIGFTKLLRFSAVVFILLRSIVFTKLLRFCIAPNDDLRSVCRSCG